MEKINDYYKKYDLERKEQLSDKYKQICKCGNDTFYAYIKIIIDDAILICSKCGEELI